MDALVQQSYRDTFYHIGISGDIFLENHRAFISEDNYYVCTIRTLPSQHIINLWKKEVCYTLSSNLPSYITRFAEQSLHTIWDIDRFPYPLNCLEQINKDYRINLIQTNPERLYTWIRDWIYEEKP